MSYQEMRRFVGVLCGVVALLFTIAAHAGPLIVPDNGFGTVDMPPASAEYLSPDEVFLIIDGLPPGTTIELGPILYDFESPSGEVPDGSLGGTKVEFSASLDWDVRGTGSLAGFNRSLTLPVTGEWHFAPRTPGDPVQDFAMEVDKLEGKILGDLDFKVLQLTGGDYFGLPGPGNNRLDKLASGEFNVHSFFDLTYQIYFEGAPGSQLQDLSGTTEATLRMEAGEPIPEPSTILLLGTGAIGLLALVWRRRQAPRGPADRR